MGIVVKHDAAGILPRRDKDKFDAGMQMVARQQAADNNLRLERMAPLKYDTKEVYGGSKAQKLNPPKGIADQALGTDPALPPMPLTSASDLMGASPQQRNQALMANIDAGMYTPEQRKAIRELVSRQTRLMTSRTLNDMQKQGAMDQFNSDFEKLLPTLGENPMTSVAIRSGQQAKKMDALQTFQTKPEVFKDFLARVDAEAEKLGVTYDNRMRMHRAKELWEEQDAFLSGTATSNVPYQQPLGAEERRYGGPVYPGQTVTVGEEGPELMRVGYDGVAQVAPNPATMARMQGGMSQPMNYAANPQGGGALPNYEPTMFLTESVVDARQQQGTPMNPERQVGDYGGSTTFGVPATLMAGPTQTAAPQASPVASSQSGAAQINTPTAPQSHNVDDNPNAYRNRLVLIDEGDNIRPPKYQNLQDGSTVYGVRKPDGRWGPPSFSDYIKRNMQRNMVDPAPKRSPRKQPIYFNPGSNSVTNTGRSPIYNEQGNFVGDPSLYDSAGAKNMRQQEGLEAPPSAMRKWTSNDGRYSTEGEMIGFRATQGGDPLASEMVRIRKKNGVEVDVPLHRLSEEDRQMVTESPQYDYQIRNQRIGGSPTGSNYQQMFDPNNPEYAAMRAPLQQQTQNEGSFVGRYGMGGVDYGVNPTTGNRVTGSVRPGGTMLQYDEPVKVHPKVTNKTIDEFMTKAARAKRQQDSEEFDRQFPNVMGSPVDISGLANATSQTAPQTPAKIFDPTSPMASKAIKTLLHEHTQKEHEDNLRILAGLKAPPEFVAQLTGQIIKPGESPAAKTEEPGFSLVDPQDRSPLDVLRRAIGLRGSSTSQGEPSSQEPTQKDIEGMTAYLQSGRASAEEKQIITDILRDAGVNVNDIKTPASPAKPPTAPQQGFPTPDAMASQVAQQQTQRNKPVVLPPKQPGVQDQAFWNSWWSNNRAAYEAPKDQEVPMSTLTSADGKKKMTGVVGLISDPIEEIGGQRVITFRHKNGELVTFYSGQLSEEDQSRLAAKSAISQKGYPTNSDAKERKSRMTPEKKKDSPQKARPRSKYRTV